MLAERYFLTVSLHFEAAHRIWDVSTYSSEYKSNLHGHSYKVVIYLGCNNLNEAGAVIDAEFVQHLIRTSIEQKYNQSCILRSDDPLCNILKDYCSKINIVDGNPTAEWLAKHFYLTVKQMLEDECIDVFPTCVEVQETCDIVAYYSKDPVYSKN